MVQEPSDLSIICYCNPGTLWLCDARLRYRHQILIPMYASSASLALVSELWVSRLGALSVFGQTLHVLIPDVILNQNVKSILHVMKVGPKWKARKFYLLFLCYCKSKVETTI